jgi:hypothetical protein
MLCSVGELIAYEGNETLITGSYIARSLENRKKLTEELIFEDKEEFKKFIEFLKYHHEMGGVKEPPEELLRINIDKFLNENNVEYI